MCIHQRRDISGDSRENGILGSVVPMNLVSPSALLVPGVLDAPSSAAAGWSQRASAAYVNGALGRALGQADLADLSVSGGELKIVQSIGDCRRSLVSQQPSKPKHKPSPEDPGFTAKNHRRHYVEHNYHDHAETEKLPMPAIDGSRLGFAVSFPLVLYHMIESTEVDGLDNIVSWCPHGRAFRVHDNKAFMAEVMHKYFRQSKISSFQRQLNLYGFARLTRKSPDKGSYYHEFFLRSRPDLAVKIHRTRVKGTKVRTSSNPKTEPNFLSMTPVGVDRVPELILKHIELPLNSDGNVSSCASSKSSSEKHSSSSSSSSETEEDSQGDRKVADVKPTRTLSFASPSVAARIHQDTTVPALLSSAVQPVESISFDQKSSLDALQDEEGWICREGSCKCEGGKCKWFVPSSDAVDNSLDVEAEEAFERLLDAAF